LQRRPDGGREGRRCAQPDDNRLRERGDAPLALAERVQVVLPQVTLPRLRRSAVSPEGALIVGGVVLAAGAATRFGSPKQRLLLGDVLERLRQSSEVDEVVVVAGAFELSADARVIKCPEWERGGGTSLRCGLDALAPETA